METNKQNLTARCILRFQSCKIETCYFFIIASLYLCNANINSNNYKSILLKL